MTTTWPGWSNDNTLVIPLEDAPPSAAVDIDGLRFEPKGELHITLVGRELGNELRAALGDRLESATRPAFEALDWSYIRTGQFERIERVEAGDDGKPRTVGSIIEHVELPAMAFYIQWLGELLGRQLAMPPPHVTLYTHQTSKGIGIATHRALRAQSRGEVDPARIATA